ncbi:aluminum-activated malate transporter 10 isoform X2 [Amborella trichopoda]|uniref:aluminum-activated malate transporter 10 isoform X2 n=1 Tax=Amborella trichopoda TaxID=13333 RepID=UPI0009BD079D|nr:aluminum-activated malate transporter 10 isoform X2 [Amborella trichopoda]|eukprot:XP_020531337.1 aluminum-activated malate transporter 10 isoform X2 [Amborella trichopoda]
MVVLNKEVSNQLEWRVTIGDGSSMQLRSDPRCFQTAWEWVFEVVLGWKMEVEELIQRICKIGKEDPRKVAHCFKVGLALTLVSLFYYMRPLYEGVGGNAMWAVMTVVVVFESSVGATLGKGLNRALGTILAGALGIGVHYVAEKSGPTIEPIILGLSVFLIGYVAEYFEEKDVEGISIIDKATLKGYKCVLNSKATEESLANFATWEPAHGNFGFRHPWKQYLKIGTTSRFSAYCIEALSACTSSEVQVCLQNHLTGSLT